MKKFLIIQLRSEDAAVSNELEAILKYGDIEVGEFEQLRLEKTPLPPINFDQYSAIIIGGSPFDVSTPQNDKSDVQVRVEKELPVLFEKIIEQDFPFLGACSGIGQLGKYLGANITRKYGEPVSGIDVFVTDFGKNDDLLEGLPAKFRALVGHKEACDEVPPGATLLAKSQTCPVQMFRVKQNIYATQFHPEADASVFITRIEIYKKYGYFPAETASELADQIRNEIVPIPNEILKRFVKKYRYVES